MRKSMLKIMLGGVVALSVASGAAFAQGGNGNGGTGGGNAHSAATAGMTHWGDPIASPLDPMPGSTMSKMDAKGNAMQPISQNDSMSASKTTQ